MISVRIYRAARWLHLRRIPALPWALKTINRIVFATVLPPQSDIAPDVLLSYEGLGTVINRRAVIRSQAVIGTGVTIGGRSGIEGAPTIERGAMIGSGAKVLGPITIGEFASVGANAVVMSDVPPYGVAVGMPARVVKINRPEDIPNYRDF
jgi:serine O-acetyltransferase